MNLLHKIGKKPFIAGLGNIKDIDTAVSSEVDNIFIMDGTVTEVAEIVRYAKQKNKGTFVCIDLIKGLSNIDTESVNFIAKYTGADGIITPKRHLIAEAKRCGIYGILDLFLVDSLSVRNALHHIKTVQPDGIEIKPGIVTKIISLFAENHNIPIISSGFIQTRSEAVQALEAGATSLSVSEQSLWSQTFEDLYNQPIRLIN